MTIDEVPHAPGDADQADTAIALMAESAGDALLNDVDGAGIGRIVVDLIATDTGRRAVF